MSVNSIIAPTAAAIATSATITSGKRRAFAVANFDVVSLMGSSSSHVADGIVAAHARQFLGVAVHGGGHVRVAAAAVRLDDVLVHLPRMDRLVEVARGERDRVVPAVARLRPVLAHELARRVAVVADGDG